jgi:hypothetical protein
MDVVGNVSSIGGSGLTYVVDAGGELVKGMLQSQWRILNRHVENPLAAFRA